MERTCPECGGRMEREIRTIPYTYKGDSIEVQQPGEWCQECGEGVLAPEDRKATAKILHDHRAKVDRYLTTEEIRRVRKKLHLTQHQAAHFFGGGPNAFSRYERGETMQARATDNLLRVLDKHPELMKELEGNQDEAK